MKCQFCGMENPDGVNFCKDCGKGLCTSTGEMPPEIRQFNWGAFLLGWVWAFGHKLWGAAALLFVVPVLLMVLIFVAASHVGPVVALLFYFLFIAIMIAVLISFGLRANVLAWRKTNDPDARRFLARERVWAWASASLVAFSIAMNMLGNMSVFNRARNRSRLAACSSQLLTVETGLRDYLIEEGNLLPDDIYGDSFCHYIVPDSPNAKSCAGSLKERVDRICETGSYHISLNPDKNQYEIVAKPDFKDACEVCVTEMGINPEDYNDCVKRKAKSCLH